jgi:hypothetical protein
VQAVKALNEKGLVCFEDFKQMALKRDHAASEDPAKLSSDTLRAAALPPPSPALNSTPPRGSARQLAHTPSTPSSRPPAPTSCDKQALQSPSVKVALRVIDSPYPTTPRQTLRRSASSSFCRPASRHGKTPPRPPSPPQTERLQTRGSSDSVVYPSTPSLEYGCAPEPTSSSSTGGPTSPRPHATGARVPAHPSLHPLSPVQSVESPISCPTEGVTAAALTCASPSTSMLSTLGLPPRSPRSICRSLSGGSPPSHTAASASPSSNHRSRSEGSPCPHVSSPSPSCTADTHEDAGSRPAGLGACGGRDHSIEHAGEVANGNLSVAKERRGSGSISGVLGQEEGELEVRSEGQNAAAEKAAAAVGHCRGPDDVLCAVERESGPGTGGAVMEEMLLQQIASMGAVRSGLLTSPLVRGTMCGVAGVLQHGYSMVVCLHVQVCCLVGKPTKRTQPFVWP